MPVTSTLHTTARTAPHPLTVLELFKPVTWFPPMWAFACGAISSGATLGDRIPLFVAGIVLTGPLACAASQAVNDWFDRFVDAINEPGRPIPSGRMPGNWGLGIACFWSAVAIALGAALGVRGLIAALVATAFSWAYSAPPLRLKRNGWFGNAAVGISYEGIAWITGAALLVAPAMPDIRTVWLALLYSAGAHGIMTLNDFKSIQGDRRSGIRSLPAQLGPARAGVVACLMMLLPQCIVIALLLQWERPMHAAATFALVLIQLPLMRHMLAQPKERAAWYNGTGTTLFVLGMMVSAFALRGL